MIMGNPKVSIIISVFGQLEHTRRCLDQLSETLAGKVDYEVIVIDDASRDGTVEFLKGLGEPYRIILNEENRGFARNNNLGAREARGEYLCLLNNDVFVRGDWLSPMLDVFREREKVGLVGNVQRLSNSLRYDHMGVVFSPRGLPRHYGQGFLHRPFQGETRRWSAVTAACCVMEAAVFEQVGGFDEIFLNGCEDIDLCLRLASRGYFNYVVHDSVVDHVKCATEGRKTHNLRNTEYLLDRWGESIRRDQALSDKPLYRRMLLFGLLTRPWTIFS